MDFLKSLLLVILVPLVVSSFTFASRYGASDEMMKGILQKQDVIITELKSTRVDITNLKTQQDLQRQILGAVKITQDLQGDVLNRVDREVVKLKAEVAVADMDNIRGGNERINRLEDKVFGK